MSLSKSSGKYNRQGWENSEFPILCEICLGDNPYVRMLKDKAGSECQVCSRPYTSFKWCPGKRMRHKTTVICQLCAKLKNVCQTCLFDLEYGLPVAVRDNILDVQDNLPRSDANREYYRQMVEKDITSKDATALVGGMVDKVRRHNEILERLARKQPSYNRNRPHLCSFWQKGLCNRGDECPFRHEMPTDYDSCPSQKGIRDRYYGNDDKLASKILDSINGLSKLESPRDRNIMTLCIGDINSRVKESDLYNYYQQFGQVKKVTIPEGLKYAFVEFLERKTAENAAENSFNKLRINDTKLRVMWAKTAQPGLDGNWLDSVADHAPIDPLFPHPDTIKNPDLLKKIDSSAHHSQKYPSQDPSQLGSSKKPKTA